MVLDEKELCLRLGEERRRLRLNQSRIAETCKVSTKTVGRWEKSIPIPADKLAQLIDLGYNINYILTGVRLPEQVTSLEAATRQWSKKKLEDGSMPSRELDDGHETWLEILEHLMEGDTERLKQIGFALVGYTRAESET